MGTRLIETAKKINNKIQRLENLIKETQQAEISHFNKNLLESQETIKQIKGNVKKYKGRIRNFIISIAVLFASSTLLAWGVNSGLSVISLVGASLIGSSCFVIGYTRPSSFAKYKENKKRAELLETVNNYQVYTKSEKLQAMERSLAQKKKEYQVVVNKISSLMKSKKETTAENITEVSLEK